jgi:hypothetical protein
VSKLQANDPRRPARKSHTSLCQSQATKHEKHYSKSAYRRTSSKEDVRELSREGEAEYRETREYW